jgi:hypothetical protein
VLFAFNKASHEGISVKKRKHTHTRMPLAWFKKKKVWKDVVGYFEGCALVGYKTFGLRGGHQSGPDPWYSCPVDATCESGYNHLTF